MWGVYHRFEVPSRGEGLETETKDHLLFTTDDQEYAFKYRDKWNHPSNRYWDSDTGRWYRCGSLVVQWIPDPIQEKSFQSPAILAWDREPVSSQVNLVETWA